ncbi:hypothetical protein CPB83DRAFT_848813 [Crepidotus variabilis]|uniref:Uncharacterized protein n=1 Tax=Crepidotus variabilis TaxID=179855 RepID=A0A9P6JSV2_9AGAR|nr:hypothetical protein CPB83DRAFT_848813 [Crepidotus variabilis]
MDVPIDKGPFPQHPGFNPFPPSFPPYIGAVLFETFLYGLYTILMAICVVVFLPSHRKIHWLLPVSAVIMYLIASGDIAYTYYLLFGKLLKGGASFENVRPKYWLYVTNNVIADTLLLYRCYVVWDYRKAVFVGPVFLLVGGTVVGYLFEGSPTHLFSKAWIYLVLTVSLNVILTALAAGRIWWLSRKAKPLLDPGLLQRYSGTIGILIESGFIYTFYVVLDLALHFNQTGTLVLDAGLIQVVGIMPTLIIAQVGLGRAMHADAEANTRLEQSKIQIQSPRSGYNRSLADNADSFTHEPQRTSRVSSRRDEMRQHGYGRCPCGECSSSSQTFIMRDYHHHPRFPSAELHRLPSFQPDSPLQGLGIQPLPLPDPEQQAGFSTGFDPDNSFELPNMPADPAQWIIYSAPEFVEEESRDLSPDPYQVELGIAR